MHHAKAAKAAKEEMNSLLMILASIVLGAIGATRSELNESFGRDYSAGMHHAKAAKAAKERGRENDSK
jgi:hypothetical protein